MPHRMNGCRDEAACCPRKTLRNVAARIAKPVFDPSGKYALHVGTIMGKTQFIDRQWSDLLPVDLHPKLPPRIKNQLRLPRARRVRLLLIHLLRFVVEDKHVGSPEDWKLLAGQSGR